MYNERLGKWVSGFVIGFNLTFIPLHFAGIPGHAAPDLYLSSGRGWELYNLIASIGVIFQIAAVAHVRLERDLFGDQRSKRGGRRSLGRLDAGMGHQFAAAGIQLRKTSGGSQQPAALGSEASARSGLEIRTIAMAATVTPADAGALEREWTLPDRGTLGIILLIITESALFTIFVVAYLVYIGKSLNGPFPKDVLELPIVSSICLLSSSLTIVIAEHALKQNQARAVQAVVGRHDSAGRRISDRHRSRMVPADLQRRPDHQHQPVRHNLLLAGRTAREPRDRRAVLSAAGDGGLADGLSHPASGEARQVSFLVLAFRGRHLGVVFTVVYVIGR